MVWDTKCVLSVEESLARYPSSQLENSLRWLNICIVLSGIVTVLPFCSDAFVWLLCKKYNVAIKIYRVAEEKCFLVDLSNSRMKNRNSNYHRSHLWVHGRVPGCKHLTLKVSESESKWFLRRTPCKGNINHWYPLDIPICRLFPSCHSAGDRAQVCTVRGNFSDWEVENRAVSLAEHGTSVSLSFILYQAVGIGILKRRRKGRAFSHLWGTKAFT